MAKFRSCTTIVAALLVLVTTISAQTLAPNNDTSDIPPYHSSPRFWVNGTDFDAFRIIPLGWYSQISQGNFLSIDIDGRLNHVDASNANDFTANAINYISCDPEDYTGVLGAADVLRMVASAQQNSAIILYSSRAVHCEAYNLRTVSNANGIFSTLNPELAGTVASQISDLTPGAPAIITPDTQSYMVQNSSSGYTTSAQPGPTTAVAMIILYTITGIITALFVVIIVTGAIRAHRHPERYGPSNIAGRPRRTRAKGIARAMLDTIPIVKFGDKDETPKKEVDIEMSTPAEGTTQGKSATANVAETDTTVPAASVASASNADGTDEAGQLGCSICTEDFTKGEEVRVLPCNHKFHPECVDPWLLNVSGTCPLCRIDLRPKDQQAQSAAEAESPSTSPERTLSDADIAPPLGHLPFRLDRDRRGSTTLINGAGRRETMTFAGLRSVASGSREDRIAALRRFRQQRRNQSTSEQPEQDEERRGLSTRLRERFRIRTRRQGEDENGEAQTQQSESSTARRQRQSSVGIPRATWHT